MSAVLELRPGLRLSPLPEPLPRPVGPLDPAAEAALRFGSVAAAAVHPFEVAAAIEAEGVTDRQVQRRYGRSDAFELAEDLYAETPRSYPEPEAAVSPWHAPLSTSVLRGCLYALPGLAFPLGAPMLKGPPDAGGLPHGTFALALSVLFNWAWNQALAHRTHARLGRGLRRSGGRCLLRGALVGTGLGMLGAVVGVLAAGHRSGGVLLFCGGQAVYLGSSCVLLVLGRELLLLRALAPATLGGAAVLLGLVRPTPLTALLLLCTVLLTLRLAGRELRDCLAEADGDSAIEPLPPLRTSVPHGLFGMAMSLLTLGIALRGGHLDLGPTVALTISMGPAEWLLYGYRNRIHGALRAAHTARGFALLSARSLALGLASYLVLLAVLGGAVGTALAGGSLGEQLPGLLALGATIWTALLLQAFGLAWAAAGICTPAAAATVAGATELVVGSTAAALLLAVACWTLGRVTVHR
ncbi:MULTISPECIES: hypothetical protein [Streptacidiphilus]|uniref:ABC transporter permease n=1 Tax=Streptacidiphilus cavernicola TaxID=3342716 RepID=A0ABV6V1B4_9ACTN|nr:hypothetical protein [Streptacidiphilus jeojiense]